MRREKTDRDRQTETETDRETIGWKASTNVHIGVRTNKQANRR